MYSGSSHHCASFFLPLFFVVLVAPVMELKPNAGSDRAWVWNTHADFADEHPKPELLAIRFLNAESEWSFQKKFIFFWMVCPNLVTIMAELTG